MSVSIVSTVENMSHTCKQRQAWCQLSGNQGQAVTSAAAQATSHKASSVARLHTPRHLT